MRRLPKPIDKEPFELRSIDANQIVSEVIELLSSTAQQRGVTIIKALSSTALPSSRRYHPTSAGSREFHPERNGRDVGHRVEGLAR